MPKRHAPYPDTFRADAVALVRRSGKRIRVIASDLGVAEESLRKWVQQATVDAGEGPPGALTPEEREERRRLRRAVQTLQLERARVKPAAACFAKETW